MRFGINPGNYSWLLQVLDMIEQDKHLSNIMETSARHAKAQEIIRNHVGFALGAALIPFPGADLLAVSAVQLNMLRQLAKLYQLGFIEALGRNIISAVVGGSVARLGASLIKIIPGVGTVIGELSMPVLSGASTYALGRVIASHFAAGGTLGDFDPRQGRRKYEAEMEEGRRVAEDVHRNQPPAPSAAAELTPLEKLQKASELRQAGVLTDTEFDELKARLLQQI
jgi:uncharacterized protein (DUF697 family)